MGHSVTHMYSVILSKSVHLLPRYYTFTQTYRKISLNTVTDTLKIQSGIFRSISESPPVDFLQKFLVNIHDSTGLPWWATIICTTIFLRSTITIPLAVYQNYILAKVYNVNKELAELSKELKKEVAIAIKLYQWDEKVAKYHYKRSLKKQWNKLIIRDNCHPVKASLLIWFQIPLWISFSVALRNLAYKLPESNLNNDIIYNQLSIEGFGWISNLTQIDPFFILPLTFGLINLGIIEIQSLSKTGPPTKFQKYVFWFFTDLSMMYWMNGY